MEVLIHPPMFLLTSFNYISCNVQQPTRITSGVTSLLINSFAKRTFWLSDELPFCASESVSPNFTLSVTFDRCSLKSGLGNILESTNRCLNRELRHPNDADDHERIKTFDRRSIFTKHIRTCYHRALGTRSLRWKAVNRTTTDYRF